MMLLFLTGFANSGVNAGAFLGLLDSVTVMAFPDASALLGPTVKQGF